MRYYLLLLFHKSEVHSKNKLDDTETSQTSVRETTQTNPWNMNYDLAMMKPNHVNDDGDNYSN